MYNDVLDTSTDLLWPLLRPLGLICLLHIDGLRSTLQLLERSAARVFC